MTRNITSYRPVDLITRLFLPAIVSIFCVFASNEASAQSEQQTVGIISGGVNGTYVRIAQNLADALDSEEIRILPILGKGSQQNIKDLLQLNGIDVAIVQSDVLDFYKNSGEIAAIEDSIRYISKLYNEEVHIVVRKDFGLVKNLEGAAVSMGRKGSGTEMTAKTLFKALGVSVEPINAGSDEALQAVKSGDIDAAVFVVGKPGTAIRNISSDDELKLLPINLGKSVQAAYFPSRFTHEDYPNIVPEGESVDTAAVGAVMAVFNWREGTPRYRAVEKFSRNMLEGLDVLKTEPGYHAKWKSVDPKTEVPGWTRFKPAAEMLSGLD